MVVQVETTLCPACGTRLSQEGWSAGLCPGCLFELALTVSPGARGDPGRPADAASLASPSSVSPDSPTALHLEPLAAESEAFTPGEEGQAGHRRIEIIHESLLSNWPRLVRWQMQDAEGAKLRDELRNQAQLWKEHGLSEDYLWSGTAYREFQLWRERYPGGLTTVEEEFAEAMTAFAERRRRRRRLAVSVVLLLVLVLATVMGGLWLRSEADARRAEASKLLALAQLRHEEDPTEALAFATASLELADTDEARVFVRGLLWETPPALEFEPGSGQYNWLAFSPEGSRVAAAGFTGDIEVLTADGEGGEAPVVLSGHASGPIGTNLAFWSLEGLLATGHPSQDRVRVWSFPGGRLVRQINLGGPGWWQVVQEDLFAEVVATDAETGHEIHRLRSWRLPDGKAEELGTVDWTALGSSWSCFDSGGKRWIYGKGRSVFYRPVPARDDIPDRLIGSHENEARFAGRPTERDRVWTRDAATGEMRGWDLSQDEPRLSALIPPIESAPEGRIPDPSGRWAVHRFWEEQNRQARVWDLESWPEARALALRRSGSWNAAWFTFHPRGDWLVVSTHSGSRLTFWPLRRSWPRVVDGCSGWVRPIAFSSDGQWLGTFWGAGNAKSQIRLWPLPGIDSLAVRTLTLPEEKWWEELVFDPQGHYLFVAGMADLAYVVPLDGSPPRGIEGLSDPTKRIEVAISPSGRRVATAFSFGEGIETVRVLDLESGELHHFDLPESPLQPGDAQERAVWSLEFVDEETLYTAGDGGVRKWNLQTGAHELVLPSESESLASMTLSPGSGMALVQATRLGVPEAAMHVPTTIFDLDTGAARELPAFGNVFAPLPAIALDASGMVAAIGDAEGVIRVGRVSEEDPHLLVGHAGSVDSVVISPDGRWIASTGEDNTLRLWPMPDLDKPPLHILEREALVARLKSLTNIRVVRDEESAEGWTVRLDPFPGWKEAPTW